MRYLPKSADDRKAMLREVGAGSIDDLFASIPAEYRLQRDLKVAPAMGESEIMEFFRSRAAENAAGYAIFLGAGAYHHYRPVVIDSLISRGEFFTAYTPYQAEISQGTLQVIFEFQSMMCDLTGMEVANASMYDGSSGAAEAMMMAVRITGREKLVVARSVHPEYREVVETYAAVQGLSVSTFGFGENGRVDNAEVEELVDDKTACILVQSPNFFGTVEDVAALAELAHSRGALLVVSIAEALSLGIIKPPAEADIVSMEAQSFGVPLSFGGPYCGVIATKEKFVRQIPGRLVGETRDKHGRRGFVLALSTREQHIRREKATSNICTNQALLATVATIFLCIYGREGLKELAYQNLAKTAYAVKEFGKALPAKNGAHGKQVEVLFNQSPRFNEFVLHTAEDPHEINERLLHKKVVGGLSLKKFYPELGNASLWCCTEINTKAQIDSAAQELAR